jgi:hypothetical protein
MSLSSFSSTTPSLPAPRIQTVVRLGYLDYDAAEFESRGGAMNPMQGMPSALQDQVSPLGFGPRTSVLATDSTDGHMRSRRLWGIVAVVVIAVFVFLPILPTVARNAYSGSQDDGWVSPSFALFQCGAATGGYSLTVPGGGGVGGPEPFWVSNSVWNCEFPHW